MLVGVPAREYKFHMGARAAAHRARRQACSGNESPTRLGRPGPLDSQPALWPCPRPQKKSPCSGAYCRLAIGFAVKAVGSLAR